MQATSLMQASGQMWKLHAGTTAYAIAVFLIVWAAIERINYQLLVLGVIAGLLGTILCAVSIRCPKCGARWYWSALKNVKPGFARRLVQQSQCPSCGYTAQANDA